MLEYADTVESVYFVHGNEDASDDDTGRYIIIRKLFYSACNQLPVIKHRSQMHTFALGSSCLWLPTGGKTYFDSCSRWMLRWPG
jgi:hypothetical protein